MALITDGILTHKLPWGLVLIGVFLTLAIELMGVSSLPVAVGVYLPITTSAGMFAGGIVRWLVERRSRSDSRSLAEIESGPGVLFASGLIAGGAICGSRSRQSRVGAARAAWRRTGWPKNPAVSQPGRVRHLSHRRSDHVRGPGILALSHRLAPAVNTITTP